MSLPVVQSKPVRFHVSLNVSDLQRSINFYRILFDMPPAKERADYAKFEPDVPPLVLSLEPNGRCGGGTLNHLGIRLNDARQLVGVQERLNAAVFDRNEKKEWSVVTPSRPSFGFTIQMERSGSSIRLTMTS